MKDDKIDAFGLLGLHYFFKDLTHRNKLNKAMSPGDSKDGPFEFELLRLLNNAIFNPQNTLVVIDLFVVAVDLNVAGCIIINSYLIWLAFSCRRVSPRLL